MLKIFNDLETFFKDNYERIHVREYARVIGISPPSASKRLNRYYEEGMLIKEQEHNYIYYMANRNNHLFIRLSQIYWSLQLKDFLDYLEKKLVNPLVVLFGSFSKAEITSKSDIDIAVFSLSKKELKIETFENKLKRKIQLFQFTKPSEVQNKDLLKNIYNGFRLLGSW